MYQSLKAPLLAQSRANIFATNAASRKVDSDDEESVPLSSSYYSYDDDHLAEADELPKRLKWHRRSVKWEFGAYGRVKTVLMYLMYILTVIGTVLYESHAFEQGTFDTLGTIGFNIWFVLINSNLLTGTFCRQERVWGGYPFLCLNIINVATYSIFFFAFQNKDNQEEHHPFRYWLIVLMAVSLFLDQQVVEPSFYELYLFYQGKITTDEDNQQPVTGVNSKILQQVAIDASQAVGIGEDAIDSITKVLKGQNIRDEEGQALDDMALIAYKLSKVTTMVPLGCRKGYITTLQYRNLTRQILMFLRSFKRTGKFSKDEANQKRTLPLSTYESMKFMGQLTWQLKWTFAYALIPGLVTAIISPFVGPLSETFLTEVMMGNMESARRPYAMIMLINFIITPIMSLWTKFTTALFTTKLSDLCRKKMLGVVLKGGTQFSETHRPGKLVDAFSNQINQLELFTSTMYIGLIPNFMGILASVGVAFLIYPFASILFISLIPIVLSIDYFANMATRASFDSALSDGTQAGKIASVVECLQAIRSCDAGAWVESNVRPYFKQTKSAHYQSFLSSGLLLSAFEFYTALYSLLIFIPMGLFILDGTLSVAVYIGLLPPVTTMVAALWFLGTIQSQVSLFSGALKVIRDLMDHTLDEDQPSKLAGEKTALAPLSDSLKLSDVNFRYRHDLPNVLTDVKMDVRKGTYTVLCGPSGSGKSSVLNLLMRFREPDMGLIEWDGTDIFSASLGSFREHVTVMFQKTMIFQASVRENILFGLPEREVGSIEKAANDAEIHEDILRMPDGYDTVIGGDAIGSMSGGQLQRICLARALYRQPCVLLLDEATSALDAVSEHAIIDTLVRLRDQQGLTLVSVSHHPSTAVEANQILVLNRGAISEEGTYSELMSLDGGIFKGLAEAGNKEQGE